MLDRIAKGLEAQLANHRIVLWYDPEREFRAAFDGLALPGVEKIVVANNEFAVKYRILREAPKQRFLLYREGPRPENIDNWLLDVELAHGVFKADQVAMWLGELGLPIGFEDVVREHQEFFRSGQTPGEAEGRGFAATIPRRAADADARRLRRRRRRLRHRCRSAAGGVGRGQGRQPAPDRPCRARAASSGTRRRAIFGYRADKPSLSDFAITLFKSCYRVAVGEEAILAPDALVLFRRWKNNRNASDAFAKLSAEYAEVLGIAPDLAKRDFRSLIEIDYFEEVDRAIIRALVREVSCSDRGASRSVRLDSPAPAEPLVQ